MLGDNIQKLRKDKRLSQEQLGEKVNVTRQTISIWELNETTPNPDQLKLLSVVLGVSIDDLVGNDVKNIIVEKVSNTEKLAGMIITGLKIIGVLIITFIIIFIVNITVFTHRTTIYHDKTSFATEEYVCDKTYSIEVSTDGTFNTYDMPANIKQDLLDIVDFDDLEKTEREIQEYFEELRKNVKCE